MSARSRLGAIAALVGVIALSSALSGSAASRAHARISSTLTAPGTNGRIAFRRWLDSSQSTGAIFTAEASGKNQRQVTRPESGAEDGNPDWSPDGSLLAF